MHSVRGRLIKFLNGWYGGNYSAYTETSSADALGSCQ